MTSDYIGVRYRDGTSDLTSDRTSDRTSGRLSDRTSDYIGLVPRTMSDSYLGLLSDRTSSDYIGLVPRTISDSLLHRTTSGRTSDYIGPSEVELCRTVLLPASGRAFGGAVASRISYQIYYILPGCSLLIYAKSPGRRAARPKLTLWLTGTQVSAPWENNYAFKRAGCLGPKICNF